MMEIDFFSELGEILIPNIFINLISHVMLNGSDFNLMFHLIDFSISINVVIWIETCRVFMRILMRIRILILHHEISIVFVVIIILES